MAAAAAAAATAELDEDPFAVAYGEMERGSRRSRELPDDALRLDPREDDDPFVRDVTGEM